MIELQIKPYGSSWAVFRGGKAISAACPSEGAAVTLALQLAREQGEAGGLARVTSVGEMGEARQIALFGERRRSRAA